MDALRSHSFMATASSRACGAGILGAQSLYDGRNKKVWHSVVIIIWSSNHHIAVILRHCKVDRERKNARWTEFQTSATINTTQWVKFTVTVREVLLQMYLPVVEAAGVYQALVHSAVDGGLSSLPGTFDQPKKWHEYDPLPQGDRKHVAS